MPTTAIEVLDRRTGEVLDVTNAETVDLAAFQVNATDLKSEIADAEATVSDELLRRLDRDGEWTQRVGNPQAGFQYEIKAPSPTAGTDLYEEATLHIELIQLIRRSTITEKAAAKAQKRRLIVELELPFHTELGDVAKAVEDATVQIAGREATVVSATAAVTNQAAGIAALRKIPGTDAALDRAKKTIEPPKRKAKVVLKTKAGA